MRALRLTAWASFVVASLDAHALDAQGKVYALAEVHSASSTFLAQWADLRAVEVRHMLGLRTH